MESIVRTLVYHQITSTAATITHGGSGGRQASPILSGDGRRGTDYSVPPGGGDPATHIFRIGFDGSGQVEVDSYTPLCCTTLLYDISTNGGRVGPEPTPRVAHCQRQRQRRLAADRAGRSGPVCDWDLRRRQQGVLHRRPRPLHPQLDAVHSGAARGVDDQCGTGRGCSRLWAPRRWKRWGFRRRHSSGCRCCRCRPMAAVSCLERSMSRCRTAAASGRGCSEWMSTAATCTGLSGPGRVCHPWRRQRQRGQGVLPRSSRRCSRTTTKSGCSILAAAASCCWRTSATCVAGRLLSGE